MTSEEAVIRSFVYARDNVEPENQLDMFIYAYTEHMKDHKTFSPNRLYWKIQGGSRNPAPGKTFIQKVECPICRTEREIKRWRKENAKMSFLCRKCHKKVYDLR